MSLVFAGICSHAPGITGRAQMADPAIAEEFYGAYRAMSDDLAAANPDVLVVVAAEHFANFFMNNMPAFAVGMAESYQGPIEDAQWLNARAVVPRSPAMHALLAAPDPRNDADPWISRTRRELEVRSWHHGSLRFLTPTAIRSCTGHPRIEHQLPGTSARRRLHRPWALGEALRRAADLVPERIALVGTGGISHWPATPDSGKDQRSRGTGNSCGAGRVNDKEAMLSYTDEAGVPGCRPGRIRDSHLHQRRGGGARPRPPAILQTDSDFRRGAAPSPPWPLVLKPRHRTHFAVQRESLRGRRPLRRAMPEAGSLHDGAARRGSGGVSSRRRARARHRL